MSLDIPVNICYRIPRNVKFKFTPKCYLDFSNFYVDKNNPPTIHHKTQFKESSLNQFLILHELVKVYRQVTFNKTDQKWFFHMFGFDLFIRLWPQLASHAMMLHKSLENFFTSQLISTGHKYQQSWKKSS